MMPDVNTKTALAANTAAQQCHHETTLYPDQSGVNWTHTNVDMDERINFFADFFS